MPAREAILAQMERNQVSNRFEIRILKRARCLHIALCLAFPSRPVKRTDKATLIQCLLKLTQFGLIDTAVAIVLVSSGENALVEERKKAIHLLERGAIELDHLLARSSVLMVRHCWYTLVH